MSFKCIDGASVDFSVTTPPRVMTRLPHAGAARAAAIGLTGEAIVVEYGSTTTPPKLILRWEYLTASEASTLRSCMDSGGLLTVKTSGSATGVSCVFAPESEQLLEPILGHYADATAAGGAIATDMTPWRAEIVFYRV